MNVKKYVMCVDILSRIVNTKYIDYKLNMELKNGAPQKLLGYTVDSTIDNVEFNSSKHQDEYGVQTNYIAMVKYFVYINGQKLGSLKYENIVLNLDNIINKPVSYKTAQSVENDIVDKLQIEIINNIYKGEN